MLLQSPGLGDDAKLSVLCRSKQIVQNDDQSKRFASQMEPIVLHFESLVPKRQFQHLVKLFLPGEESIERNQVVSNIYNPIADSFVLEQRVGNHAIESILICGIEEER